MIAQFRDRLIGELAELFIGERGHKLAVLVGTAQDAANKSLPSFARLWNDMMAFVASKKIVDDPLHVSSEPEARVSIFRRAFQEIVWNRGLLAPKVIRLVNDALVNIDDSAMQFDETGIDGGDGLDVLRQLAGERVVGHDEDPEEYKLVDALVVDVES